MSRLHEIEEATPHINLYCEGERGLVGHCIPVRTFERIAGGELKASEINDSDEVMAAIVREWMERW